MYIGAVTDATLRWRVYLERIHWLCFVASLSPSFDF